MTKQTEQQSCIKICIKLEHSSTETIWIIQKATAIRNWWLAASSWQCAPSCIRSCAEVCFCFVLFVCFLWNIKSARWPTSSTARFGALQLLFFPKTKITFEREEISLCQRDSEKCRMRQLTVMWGPKVLTLKGTEASLSYVQCSRYLESSLVNASIFYIIYLETLWTDLVCMNCFSMPPF